MTDEARGLGFDRVAEDYDRARPEYPPELVDAACAGLASGARVLEVGAGTGKLTRELVARGLEVEAVEPGEELAAVARRHVGDAVRFQLGRFEDVELTDGAYDAVFSAAAFHWVEPAVGWRRAAGVLRPGGLLALLNHAGELPAELLASWQEVLPEAESWVARDPETVWRGAEERLGNVSELWSWLVKRELARPEAAELFHDVRLEHVPIEAAPTTEEAVAVLRTQSVYLAHDEPVRRELEARLRAYVDGLGGVYCAPLFAVLVTARRA